MSIAKIIPPIIVAIWMWHHILSAVGNISEMKYNENKQAYQTLREEDARLQLVTEGAQGLPLSLNEEAIIKHDELVLKINERFLEMRKIETSIIKVNNDFETLKEDYEQYKTEWPCRLQQAVEQITTTTP